MGGVESIDASADELAARLGWRGLNEELGVLGLPDRGDTAALAARLVDAHRAELRQWLRRARQQGLYLTDQV